ncbi:MAG: MurT ligase domain-containing protein, partial [Dehalococcoidia bacterium]
NTNTPFASKIECVIRRSAAVAAAKLTGGLSRRLGIGGGTALPGLVAERIDPEIVSDIAAKLGRGNVLVTGTNGKTTTARLLRSILRSAGLSPVANSAGSNMMRGIAAALAESATWTGDIRQRDRRIGVFEVDEATLPQAVTALSPRTIVFTNLFRDQLDRYGEVEYVGGIWRETIDGLDEKVTVILNADDPSLAALGKGAGQPVLFYGLEDESMATEKIEHAADARWCSICGKELVYSTIYYGHLGHWRCDACETSRPGVDVGITNIETFPQALSLTVSLPNDETAQFKLPLSGLYNAYNALAAAAAASALGATNHDIERGLRHASATFGRQERLTIGGRDVEMILAKNPAGLNEVLRTITSNGRSRNIIFFLNDDIADGRDISWIWDVDFEMLSGSLKNVTVSGVRAWDLALRLKYAGFDTFDRVELDTERALRKALTEAPEGEPLIVVPTYTAMLDVRETLARWADGKAFWRED